MGSRFDIVAFENGSVDDIEKLSVEQMRDALREYYRIETGAVDTLTLEEIEKIDYSNARHALRQRWFAHRATKPVEKLTEEEIRKLSPEEMRAWMLHQNELIRGARIRLEVQSYGIQTAIAHFGSLENALKEHMTAEMLLHSSIEGMNILVPSPDMPVIIQSMANMLRANYHQNLPLEARMEKIIADRVNEELRRIGLVKGEMRDYVRKLAEYKNLVEKLADEFKRLGSEHATDIVEYEEKIKNLSQTSTKAAKEAEGFSKLLKTAEKQLAEMRGRLQEYLDAVDGAAPDEFKKIRELEHAEFVKTAAALSFTQKKFNELYKNMLHVEEVFKEMYGRAIGEIDRLKNKNAVLSEDNARKAKHIKDVEAERDDALRRQREAEITRDENLNHYHKTQRVFVSFRERVRKIWENKKAEAKRADELESKLLSARRKRWGIVAGASAAAFLAGALLFYKPSGLIEESVPHETFKQYQGRFMVTFGSTTYEMSKDMFDAIYDEIQRDQQKAGKLFSPAEKKKYFEGRTDNLRYIKDVPEVK
ncbi:MAG: hypothetical protein QW165_02240 [Candidatus Woesearchaeota archaeon]